MGKRILVVDDDPSFAEMLQLALTAKGFEVETCLQAPAAFHRIKDWLPDLVTLDIMMPGRSGWEVANQMRANPATAHIPLLITTGVRGGMAVDESLLLEGVRHEKLFKPFELDELYRTVGRLMQDSSIGGGLA